MIYPKLQNFKKNNPLKQEMPDSLKNYFKKRQIYVVRVQT